MRVSCPMRRVAVSDSTAPRVVSIDYNPQGPYDPVGGRMAPATVDVVLTVNEALQATPYLSIVPARRNPAVRGADQGYGSDLYRFLCNFCRHTRRNGICYLFRPG